MNKRTQRQKRKSRQRHRRSKQKQTQRGQPTPRTLIDIVLPIYGEFVIATTAIEKVAEAAKPLQGHEYRLIVVDNGTPDWISNEDNTTITPRQMAEPVRALLRPSDGFHRLEQNVGYPGGVNHAVNQGRSPLILVLTADVFLAPGAIHHMTRVMDDPDVGVVGPKLLFPDDMESPHGPGGTVQHAGIAFNIQGKPVHIFIGWSRDHPKVNIRREMAAVTGACFMTRRNLWQQIGGLDQRYGAGTFEDMDYCFSIRSGGKRVVYEPLAVGNHLVGGAMLQGANKQGFNLPMNETIFRGKWAQMLSWDEWRYL
jgi:GT2 family glycosyltransferase